MKPRIPVFDTIGHGFYFGLSHYGAILRITWLPALLASILFLGQIYIEIRVSRGDFSNLGSLPDLTGMLVGIPFAALLAIPAVAVYRMAVFGSRPPRGFAYFRFGGTELQFLAAQLVTTVWLVIYLILATAVVVPLSLVLYQTLLPSDLAAAGEGAAVELRYNLGIGAWAVFSALAYFGLILMSLVQPTVVAEHRIGLWKSIRALWLGNALRLSVVWFVAGAVFLFFSSVVYLLIDVYAELLLYTILPNFSGDNEFHILFAWSLIIITPLILMGALALGVSAGINGFAYRWLVLKRTSEPAA